jgi:hypothetical protein
MSSDSSPVGGPVDGGITSVSKRPVFSHRSLAGILAIATAVVVVFFAARGAVDAAWSTPGSPQLYLIGVLGCGLLLLPFAFSIAKRSGWSASPPTWFIVHVVGACFGLALLLIHSAGQLDGPPALLLAGALFLVLQGAWARTHLPYRIAGAFAGKHRAFQSTPPVDKKALVRIIEDKRALLTLLDPEASEATFSPTLSHWIRRPWRSNRYAGLAREEMRIIGQKRAVPAVQAYWRALHIAIAMALLGGIVVHVITVTFFAGYVADGGPINWWHLADWGGPK